MNRSISPGTERPKCLSRNAKKHGIPFNGFFGVGRTYVHVLFFRFFHHIRGPPENKLGKAPENCAHIIMGMNHWNQCGIPFIGGVSIYPPREYSSTFTDHATNKLGITRMHVCTIIGVGLLSWGRKTVHSTYMPSDRFYM